MQVATTHPHGIQEPYHRDCTYMYFKNFLIFGHQYFTSDYIFLDQVKLLLHLLFCLSTNILTSKSMEFSKH